jgi:hypothetical protein
LTITGPASAMCAIEKSTDLVSWKTVAYIVNELGIVEYTEEDTNSGACFYRARIINE